jgi:subtilase family serine protease
MGPAPASLPLRIVVGLEPRNKAALDAFIADVSNPASPNFQHFLSQDEFNALYAPTSEQEQRVVDWLSASGFQVTDRFPNRLIVGAKGDSVAAARAFAVNVHNVLFHGQPKYAVLDEPSFPADVASFTTGVTGLDNLAEMQRRVVATPAEAPNAALGLNCCHFSPNDLANFYDNSSSYTGSGQTIVIAGAYAWQGTDVSSFNSQWGLPPLPQGSIQKCAGVSTSTGCSFSCKNSIEISLDVEYSHGTAPAAVIMNYMAASTSNADFTTMYNRIITDNPGHTVTTSWGSCEASLSTSTQITDDNIFANGNALGQSWFAASGDNGSDDCKNGTISVDNPANSPHVMGVGGTSATCSSGMTSGNPACAGYGSEAGWSGSGGGKSLVFVKPAYQTLSGCPTPNDGQRDVPDVSLEADPNQYGNYVINNGRWYIVGGTSDAAPQWSGFFAELNQKKGGTGLGNPGGGIYALCGGTSGAFHDISSGSNGAFTAVVGYDQVTGVGTINAVNLLNNWSAPDFSLSALPSSLSITQGSSGQSTITANPLGGFSGTVSLSASGLPNGMTASFNPTSTTSTSTLTLTANATATPGTASITVTGISGALNHTTQISVQSFARTTTMLGSSANPSTYGQSITLTATVSPSAATGTVQFLDGSTSLGSATLRNGTASLSTSSLSVGSHSITAQYGGNSTFASSTSSVLTQTVSTALSSSVAFLKLDTTTQGNWTSSYGADGYNVIGDTTAYPAYATVTPSGQNTFVWASSTSDVRALQKASNSSDRIAATWYSSSFTVDVNLTDGKVHQIALYLLDWDNAGRAESISIADATTGTVLDSRTLSSFSNGEYLVWNVSGHVKITTTLLSGTNTVLSGIFFGGPLPIPTSMAAFVKTDTTTQGNWMSSYGADGYNVIGDTTAYPAYATVTPSGQNTFVWASSTSDVRALQKGSNSSDRIAATWYSSSFTVDVNLTDGKTHQIALYLLDWDNAERAESISIADAGTGTVLDSRNVSSFFNGEYLVWNVSGHVKITTTLLSGTNIVLSGIFFGGPLPTPTSTAAFVRTDTTTQGNWKSSYGADGYNVIGDTTAYPAYATVTPSGQSTFVWASSTSDVRALQKANSASDRIAATWYSSSFMVDVNLTDGKTHQITLYLLDWDNAGRAESISIADATTGTVLDSRNVSSFSNGEYLVWNVSGHVKITTTLLSGTNTVLSGIFF